MSEIRILLIAYLLLMNLLLFSFMGSDKRRARRRERRIPEKTLFTLAALGGAAGGIIGMLVFRHKTKHISFILGFPALAVLNAVLTVLFFNYLI